MKRLTERQFFWVTAVVCALLLLKHLLVPLNPDNDTYQAMAWQLYEYGLLPYLGSWDQNFPGIVYLHWISISLFGNSTVSFRLLDALFHLASALLLFRITERWASAKIAATSAILYVLYYTHDSFWLAGQRDGFAVTFVLLALWWLYTDKPYRWPMIGLFVGVATVIRPTFGLFAIAILLAERTPPRKLLRNAISIFLSILLVWFIQFIPYAFIEGGLQEYYLATVRFTADLYGNAALPWSNLLLWNRAQKIYFTILFVGVVVVLVQRKGLLSEQPDLRRALLLLLIASALPVFVMRKFSIYHFDPLFTLLTPVCGWLLFEIAKAFRRFRAIAFAILMAVIFIRMFPRHVVKDYLAAPASAHARLHYVHDRIDHDSLFGDAAERELATYLRSNTSPDETIEIASIWPGAAWMAERRRASRFTTWYALAMTDYGKPTGYQAQWQQEYVDSIRSARPKFIVVASGPKSFLLLPENEPVNMFIRLPGIKNVLEGEYLLDTSFRGYTIFSRKQ